MVDDDYEHPNENIEYIMENILFELQSKSESVRAVKEFQNLKDEFNSVLCNACSCSSTAENPNNREDRIDECCSMRNLKQSENRKIFENSSLCIHGGNYKIVETERCQKNGQFLELVLNKNLSPSGDLIYECSGMCECNRARCRNRLVQFGPRKDLKIIDSKQFGSKGLMTTETVPCGGFICEYAGELLTKTEAQRRIDFNEKHKKMNYILCLKESCIGDLQSTNEYTIIDPSRRGNIGRYLNHSCNPNCELLSVRVDCPVPKVGIFAKRNISVGEELCFHYSGGERNPNMNVNEPSSTNNSTVCLCGSAECEKILPSLKF